MVDINAYGAPLLLAGSLLLAYKSGYLEPQQVAVCAYRTLIKSIMFVEQLMEPVAVPDDFDLVYYNKKLKLASPPSIQHTFTHAVLSWSRSGISGTSLLKPGSPVLHQVQSGKDPSTFAHVSDFRILALSGTRQDGTVVELKPPNAHLGGDVVLDRAWREHFGMEEFASIQAIDNDINVLNISEEGIVVPKREVKSF